MGDPRRPVKGAALPARRPRRVSRSQLERGISSSVGYSFLNIDNTEGQSPDAFSEGHYSLVNLLHYPVKNVMVGAELQYGGRENFFDGFSSEDFTSPVFLQIQLPVLSREINNMMGSFQCSRGLRASSRWRRLGSRRARSWRRSARIRRRHKSTALKAAYEKYRTLKEGKNADYIPALAKVDSNLFGIALVTTDGKAYTAGDVKTEVSIQSISKVFTMALVIQEQGLDSLANTMGVDATGARSIRSSPSRGPCDRRERRSEMNPLVNPGAIATTAWCRRHCRRGLEEDHGFYSDSRPSADRWTQEVYKSEADTNQRNQAIASLMSAYGHIKDNWHQATDIYTRQCSVAVNAQDLA